MATFEIRLKQRISINNEIFEPGLSVQISIYHNQPFAEPQKISDAFRRVHGIVGMKEAGMASPGWLEANQIG